VCLCASPPWCCNTHPSAHLTYVVPTREAATFWSGFVGHSRGAHNKQRHSEGAHSVHNIGNQRKVAKREARKDAGTAVGVLVTSDSFVLSRGTDAAILSSSWRQ